MAGVLVALFIAASGIDYHDSRNSGLLGASACSFSIGLLLLDWSVKGNGGILVSGLMDVFCRNRYFDMSNLERYSLATEEAAPHSRSDSIRGKEMPS